ncbi:Transcription factor, K-box [Artemisia annua]|uniref:Transcription factor, K-box n=1 Tax=Artemisia annua TaxID=35608 RepID=A0A2U1PY39_ARTAN|nr:Transcription factor, K-box [Artemisia annua]
MTWKAIKELVINLTWFVNQQIFWEIQIIGRRHIGLRSHQRDLKSEVIRESDTGGRRYLQVLFKVDLNQRFKGLRLSSYCKSLGFIKLVTVLTVTSLLQKVIEGMAEILTHYQTFKKMEESTRTMVQERLAPEYRDMFTANELTEMIQRHLEENNIKQLDITGLDQLVQQLNSFLQQVKIRKMELKMGVVKALQDQACLQSTMFEQEMELKKERKYMMDEIMAAGMDGINNDSDAAEPQPLQITW